MLMVLLNTLLTNLVFIILGLAYLILIIYTIIRILLDTHSTSKTLAYIVVVLVFPIFGIILYFSFGINYRHKKKNNRMSSIYKEFTKSYTAQIKDETKEIIEQNPGVLSKYTNLIHFIHQLGIEKLSSNDYQLLINGEEKFPEVLKTLSTAKHFIHMEYYDWENDTRGNQIKEVLLERHSQGVKVRIMFDDYASRKMKPNIVKELKKAGIEIYPVIKVKLAALANRMNHRDHRKVIIVDGHTGFVGGINISDRYDNSIDTGLYWRDTHVKITGATVHNIQRHFLINWNGCQPNKLTVDKELFPDIGQKDGGKTQQFSQVVAGGPIYPKSPIMLTYFKIFTYAKEKLYITNPYFIPSGSILDALKQAAIGGVDVRIMMPEKSDSAVVGAAAKFYYEELLQAGVKVCMYKKGFVHAKTVVADGSLSVIGTANMDIRSFDLNFEIMSITYGKSLASQLEKAFLEDLKECEVIRLEEWQKQGIVKRLTYAIARLVSSFL
jgi:cardiolipin synthase